jgi:hypothetical protein
MFDDLYIIRYNTIPVTGNRFLVKTYLKKRKKYCNHTSLIL